MKILNVVILLFIILETLNVLILYYRPNSTKGNGVAVFLDYSQCQLDPHLCKFINYLVNWVAGTKLIFIVLLIVILFTGTPITKFFTLVALIISISTFYKKLYPIIKELDQAGRIEPKGYSKTLYIMITAFISIFSAVMLYLIFKN